MTGIKPASVARFAEENPLALALVLSLVIHLGAFGGWHLGKKLGWWQHQPTWLVALTKKLANPAKARTTEEQAKLNPTIPMTFVEIDPATAVTEDPKDAKFYSTKNTKASNPDPKDQTQPKLDGKQEQLVRVLENDKPKPLPLQPVRPDASKVDDTPDKPAAKSETAGDLAVAKPEAPKDGQMLATTGDSQLPPKKRPTRISEELAKKNPLVGEKLRQSGGVSRLGVEGLDTKSSIWGNYDYTLIKAIEDQWYEIIDSHNGSRKYGKVVVTFELNHQGYVKKCDVLESEVGELQATMCQSAIIRAQSFGPWTSAMRQSLGSTVRSIKITFFYNGN